jgi:hypothetical protein
LGFCVSTVIHSERVAGLRLIFLIKRGILIEKVGIVGIAINLGDYFMAMNNILVENAKVMAKGQITLPKDIPWTLLLRATMIFCNLA